MKSKDQKRIESLEKVVERAHSLKMIPLNVVKNVVKTLSRLNSYDNRKVLVETLFSNNNIIKKEMLLNKEQYRINPRPLTEEGSGMKYFPFNKERKIK